MQTTRKIFVNLAVKDLPRSQQFFAQLGFEFNPQFTNDQAACMVVSDDAFVMLLVEPYFQTFIQKTICDATKRTEAIHGLSCESRGEVDALYHRAIVAGGRPCRPLQDYGFMYSRSFYDLDGHHWEMIWMDAAHIRN